MSDEKPKRVVRRRRIQGGRAAEAAPISPSKLESSLNSIYQDTDGTIPNMKKIDVKKNNSLLKIALIVLAIGVGLAALAWAGLFLYPGAKFSEKQITLAISGPGQATAGAAATYTIDYTNGYDLALHNATINLYFPNGFAFASSDPAASNAGHNEWHLNTIPAHRHGTIAVTGQFYGMIGDAEPLRATFVYQPENFQSNLETNASFSAAITDSPIKLTISGPDTAAAGAAADYVFTPAIAPGWMPPASTTLTLIPQLPVDFKIVSSSPPLDTRNSWPIVPNSSSTVSAPFHLTGIFTKPAGTVTDQPATVGAAIKLTAGPTQAFTLATASLQPHVAERNLDFNVAVNGGLGDTSIRPGGNLLITTHLKNSGANEMDDATIKLTIDAPSLNKQSVLKWTTVNDKNNGDIHGAQLSDAVRRGEIVWTKKQIPGLAVLKPNDEVSIDVGLPLKTSKEIDLGSLTGASITVTAAAQFTDQAGGDTNIAAAPLNVTINSDSALETRDRVATAGGRETHAASFVLTNTFHELKNVTVSAGVFGDTTIALGAPTAGAINYSDTDQKIIWTIPDLPPSVDVANAPFTLTINSKNPTQNALLGKPQLTADDAVTGQKIQITANGISLP